MHTAIVQRKQKAVCKRTAKFIDKLKPCKYSLTNRELKKQIFSNLEHINQIARVTEIPTGKKIKYPSWIKLGFSLFFRWIFTDIQTW